MKDAAETSDVLLTRRDGVATITLNRPGKLNALTRPMIAQIVRVLDLSDADDQIRAVVFTGAGRAFCAGADLSSGDGTFDYSKRAENDWGGDMPGDDRDWGGWLALRLFRFRKPLIAAVRGAAVGIGATMQLPMDIRLAATDAKFGFVFARRGIAPEAASTWFLPRLVGISTALEWAYSGRLVPAEEACRRGLVRSLHSPETLLEDAHALALELTQDSAPVSVALTRQLMWRMMTADHPMVAHRAESRAVRARGKSPDAREGVAAFVEKRPSAFTDRVSTDLPDIFPDWREPPFQ